MTNALSITDILNKAAEIAEDPLRFRALYEDDPCGFVEEVLGVYLWDSQKDVLRALVDRRRVAVRSGHGTGKTFVTACSVLWWLYARQGLVITTAPTWNHVEAVLWREINEIALRAPVKLPCLGEYQTERRVAKHWFALGLSTTTPSAFQGFHHPRLLVVVDEAPGVAEQVHLEISTLAVGEKNCILMIGNPTTTSGTFYEAFKHPDTWKCMRISCMDHPNVVEGKEIIPGAVTRSWIDERRDEWGEAHPFWYSRVLGEFPKISNRGVIPLGWLERAQNEEKRKEALYQAETDKTPRVGGLDVARYGENQCVLTVRRGDAIEFQESWGNLSLMETTGKAVIAIQDYGLKALVIDAAGVGAGVYDRLVEQRLPVYAYNGGHRAFTPGSYTNRRTEMWWAIRVRLEKQRLWLPPNSEKLIGELVTPEYEINSSGRIKVQTKEDLLKDGKKSPDMADSLILCFALDENPEAELAPPRPKGTDHMTMEMIYGNEAEFGQFPENF